MADTWTETRHGEIAVLTFARPPHNWMNLLSMIELAGHLERLAAQSDEVTVVMLTWGVDGYFIAHADLDDLAILAEGGKVDGDFAAWTEALHLLEIRPQPSVAAIDGQAMGRGL
jgi:enoyl-CoA hydratase